MFKTLRSIYNNLSIKIKIFIFYIAILCITFIILLQSNTLITARQTRREVAFSAEKSLNQTKSFLDFKAASSREIVNILASNGELQNILKIDSSVYQDNIGQWLPDKDNIYEGIYASQTNPDIKDIKIYMKEGPASAFETDVIYTMDTFQRIISFKDYDFLKPATQWYKGEEFSDETSQADIVVLKNIVDNINHKKNIGVIRIDFESSVFTDVLNESNITESSVALLTNSNYILCNSDISQKAVDPTLLKSVQKYVENLKIDKYPYWDFEVTIDNQKLLLGVDEIALTKWHLILIIPETDVLRSISHTNQQTLALFILTIPLAFVMTYIATISLTRRLSKLASEMHNLDTSTFHKEITPSSRDEIGILTQNFNYMLTKISMLLDEKYELGQSVKNAELIALQAQINPHFLYNTLDQLYWMGVRYNVPDISNLVIDLSRFYKLSLSKGKSIVTLENEIELVKAYVNIQNVRFDNIITLEISLLDEYSHYKIPKITLQPIVENAILHGICQKEEPGTIRITAYTDEEYFYIIIKDDGQGMDEETLLSLLNNQQPDSNVVHGYGLSNINSRLKYFYGPEYGLSIDSTFYVGTEVKIRLPLTHNGKL